jgi:hypothetical protein
MPSLDGAASRALRESRRPRHPREKCAPKCVFTRSNSLPSSFFTIADSALEGWAWATPSGPENRRSLNTPAGSTPAPSSKILRTRSSAERERDLAEVEAAGSNPAGFATLHADVAQLAEALDLGSRG